MAVSFTGWESWERTVLSQAVHETATYRCDDTRDCVMQFWPPDDEHNCSKHVETWNKLTVKKSFFFQLGNYWDTYTFSLVIRLSDLHSLSDHLRLDHTGLCSVNAPVLILTADWLRLGTLLFVLIISRSSSMVERQPFVWSENPSCLRAGLVTIILSAVLKLHLMLLWSSLYHTN